MFRIVCAAGALAGTLFAQRPAPPAIGQNGVVNAASHIPPTLAGGDLAPGALFSISGVRLGSLTRTTVSLSRGAASMTAKLVTATPTRIEAIVPEKATPGAAFLVVKVDGLASLPFAVRIAASNPGLFSRNRRGWGPGSIDNVDAGEARHANSFANPARPGQSVILSATGFASGAAATVVVGNRSIRAGRIRAGRHAGEQEIAVALPADVPQGCYVPVYVQAAPNRASNVVTLAIRSGAGACLSGKIPMLDGKRMGVAVISRSRTRGRKAKRDSVNDEAAAAFAVNTAEPILAPLLLLPPPGTCTSYTGSFQENTVLPGSITDALMQELEGRGLDAGETLSLTQASGSGSSIRTIAHERGVPGFYRSRLGSDARGAPPLFLSPAELTLAGLGGKDVPAFTVDFRGPSSFDWTDEEEITVVDRAHELPVHWRRGPSGGWIIILATNVDQITTAMATILCTARVEDHLFAIPSALLANMPATMDIPGIPYDQLFVASLRAGPPPRIPTRTLDDSAVISLFAFSRFVEYH